MMLFLSALQLIVTGDLADLDEETDALYEALLETDDVIDPDLAVSLETGRVDVQMVIEADDELDATARAACFLRAAIHTVGGYTPGWEKTIRGVTATARAAELASA